MKKLGWLLFLMCSLNGFAQDVVISPPLSVEPEAGRQMVKDTDKPVGTLVVPSKIDINPVDGQLKLEDKKTEDKKPENKKEEVKAETKKETSSSPDLVDMEHFYSLEKYLQFSFGYLNSRWEKADPSLDNGSTLTDFRVVVDMNQHNQFGFAIEMIHDTTGEAIPENIRALQYKLFLDYHRTIFTERLDWIAGIALSLGDYSIKKLSLNTDGQEVYTKIKSGTMYGLIPSAGLRFYLGGRNSIDITVEYHQYFSKPQSYIGGLAFVPRFSFAF